MSSLNQSVIVTDICHFSGFLAFESISKFGETPYLWVLVGCFNHFSLKKWETPATPILAYQKSEASNLGLANLPQTLESGSRNRCKEAETMGSPFWWRVRSAASQCCRDSVCVQCPAVEAVQGMVCVLSSSGLSSGLILPVIRCCFVFRSHLFSKPGSPTFLAIVGANEYLSNQFLSFHN